jgi:S1-C subfamily serine protease
MPQPRFATATRRRGPASAVIVALALIGAASCSSGDTKAASTATTTPVLTAGVDGPAAELQNDFVNLVKRVRPSVVEISTTDGLGSGVAYDDKGNIVTNAHVVGNATQFTVTLDDGRISPATLVGTYPPDDLAVVRIQGDTKLSPATFADSSQVQVGQISLAIGNPLGLASSVTEGIVSSVGRTVSEGGGIVLPSTIQTSAPINPGNSGGALVGLDGKVMGIPTLAATVPELGGGAAPGIGFAIPSNTARRIADQLISSGKVTNSGRAALGITGATVGTPTGQPVGVLVRSVAPGGPADAAGITTGDLITAINGKPTRTLDDLGTILADLKPGDTATVDVTHRDGTKASIKVSLGSL